jgi:hypothetical protein
MTGLSIRPSKNARRTVCNCCGKERITVWGLVPKSGAAHAVYYGHMHAEQVGQPGREVSLAICLGDWTDENIPPAVNYLHITVRQDREMTINDADETLVFGNKLFGKPMTREDWLRTPLKAEFLAVAEFVTANDPAIRSFLDGLSFDLQGRTED